MKAGTTSVRWRFSLESLSTGDGITAKVAADLTAYYCRQGQTPVSIVLSNLAAVNSAYASGGVKERDAINMKGSYRIDLPDAMVAVGSDGAREVELNVFCTGSFVYKETIPLDLIEAADVNTSVGTLQTTATAVKAKTDNLPTDPADASDIAALISAVSTTLSGLPAAVWAFATRTLSTFGFSFPSVWDETAAGHNTAGTMGQKLNAAGGAMDPLTNLVPGTYAAGTAGYIIGHLSGISAGESAGIERNQAIPDFYIVMFDANGNRKPGLTVTAAVRKDNVDFVPCTVPVLTEAPSADGGYLHQISASDTNGKVITFRYTAPGGVTRYLTAITKDETP